MADWTRADIETAAELLPDHLAAAVRACLADLDRLRGDYRRLETRYAQRLADNNEPDD